MSDRRRTGLGLLLVAVVVGSWILAAPRWAGPDEPAHTVRGAAILRGELIDVAGADSGNAAVELPAWIGAPNPGCYAQQPYQPAACADVPPPTGQALLTTNAAAYPLWGHVAAGIGTLAPASIGPWSARAFGAIGPILLVGLALAAVRGASRLQSAALLLAITPMAWFMFAVVNPSSLVIAGGLTLAAVAPDTPSASDRVRWLVVAGWAATVLPRRDGLIWGSLLVGIVLLAYDQDVRSWYRAFSLRQRIVLAAVTAAAVAVPVLSPTASALGLLGPFVVGAALLARWSWRRWADRPLLRLAPLVAVSVAGVAGYLALASRRSNGFDPFFVRLIVARTGENLVEAIGNLGWLDTPVPLSAVLLWVVAFGLLVAAALIAGDQRLLVAAGAVIGVSVLLAWVIESVHESYSGTYWQGRYYLPLLVAAPAFLGRARLDRVSVARLAPVVVAIGVAVSNLAFLAAIRRWAVGLSGSLLPWDWDTYGAPVHPLLLILTHGAATVLLGRWCLERAAEPPPEHEHARW